MSDYSYMMRRQLKWMFYLLAILVLGWGFTDYQTFFSGMILGAGISAFNLWFLQVKINRIGQGIVDRDEKKRTLGMLTRLATAALAAVITIRYPEIFDMIAVIIGLMTPYLVIIIDYLFHQTELTTRKRGE
ncbi:ATP synthase subunit I [Tenuibacillus multivorans]|uniref:ATP synthase protein I n=1 Tax=Tenuibacillus multivorans TaxID=237069 RepID=A0A1G9X2P0_9BACI|nr:ATP synthase subunit I [Tenuibacillus multivorans]GEL77253.1 ATP synthase subunit I [Tenuibacillus multivorans]SDM90967.1 ATP synthase protein I [Tenuibacillus multivorans]